MIIRSYNTDIRRLTTFGLPAFCGRYIEFDAPETDLPLLDRSGELAGALMLGGGSNLLFTASAPWLTVIHPTARTINFLPAISQQWVEVEVQPGVVLDDLCAIAASQGLWGIENLSGIPGEIGGATVQNVGAYGTEFKDVVVSVTCWSVSRHCFVTLSAADCRYGYRDSIFKHLPPYDALIVSSVRLRLSRFPRPNLSYRGLLSHMATQAGLPADAPEAVVARICAMQSPSAIRDAVRSIRDSKLPDPSQTGSAGSFFKNPVVTPAEKADIESRIAALNAAAGYEAIPPLSGHLLPDGRTKLSAAWLIDKAGCKPLVCGGAALWPHQPLVIVNATGMATGADVTGLERLVIDRVRDTFGVTLSPEIIHI